MTNRRSSRGTQGCEGTGRRCPTYLGSKFPDGAVANESSGHYFNGQDETGAGTGRKPGVGCWRLRLKGEIRRDGRGRRERPDRAYGYGEAGIVGGLLCEKRVEGEEERVSTLEAGDAPPQSDTRSGREYIRVRQFWRQG